MRIEVIGGMGIGKTTLCKALQASGMPCVFEKLENNPYLDLAYKDPEGFGFYSQMSFVLGNFFKIVRNSKPGEMTLFDYSTITDKAYASLFLKGKGRDLALETINFLEEKEGYADLYIYLTSSAEVQLKRIRARARDHEAKVDMNFVRSLRSYLRHFVQEAEQKGLNVMTIDTEFFDLRNQMSFASSLATEIRHDFMTHIDCGKSARKAAVAALA